MDDSFARYLANVLTAKYGFAAGTVPEAEKLASGGADFVLTRSDGLTFSAVCIVDAERDPSRRFSLTRGELIEIGKACRAKYSGRLSGAKMPASRYSLGRFLIPREQLPKTDDDLAARALTLVSTYPRDPRARFFRALALSRANDHAGAEAELRRGLAEKELLQNYFTRDLEVLLRSALAQTLMAQKRVEDARREARPVCNAGPDGSVPELLKPLELCP
jgi:hypothetical protein